jgi:hypothetical protein
MVSSSIIRGREAIAGTGESSTIVRYVDWCPHNVNGVIPTGTLASMIRQSGLPKALFRK